MEFLTSPGLEGEKKRIRNSKTENLTMPKTATMATLNTRHASSNSGHI